MEKEDVIGHELSKPLRELEVTHSAYSLIADRVRQVCDSIDGAVRGEDDVRKEFVGAAVRDVRCMVTNLDDELSCLESHLHLVLNEE